MVQDEAKQASDSLLACAVKVESCVCPLSATQNLLKKTIPDLLRVVREDTEREVAMFALEALKDIYTEVDSTILLHSVPELVLQSLTCVKDVFLKKVSWVPIV